MYRYLNQFLYRGLNTGMSARVRPSGPVQEARTHIFQKVAPLSQLSQNRTGATRNFQTLAVTFCVD